MNWFDLLLLGTGGVYLAVILWLWIDLRRRRSQATWHRPKVSVVVAARNEEAKLGACLVALRNQDYTGELEVLVVDDRSEDGTGDLVREAARTWDRLRLVRADDELRFRCPKKSALARGIEESSGELLLFTDADCQPPPGWVSSTAGLFADAVGLVAGHAYPRPGRRLRQRLLALDNLAVGALGAGSMGMGHPLSCTGRNLAYRRQVYDQVGGFAKIGHLVGGDDVYFMRLVAEKTDWKQVFNRDPEAAVLCQAADERWEKILHQKLRHAAKGGNYRGAALGLGAVVYLFHLALLVGLVQMGMQFGWDFLLLGIWGGRWLADVILLRSMALEQERSLLASLPLLEVCYIPYVLLFTVVGRLGWFRWKP